MKREDASGTLADQWLTQICSVAEPERPAFILQTDEQLKGALDALAAQIHDSMAAWNSLGLTRTVAGIFDQLAAQLQSIKPGKASVLSRIRNFFLETDSDTRQLKPALEQLDKNIGHVDSYQYRLGALARSQEAALDEYAAWIAAIMQVASDAGSSKAYLELKTVNYGREYLAAQRQLATAVSLQLQHLAAIALQIRNVSRETRTLAACGTASRVLQAERLAEALRGTGQRDARNLA